MFIGKMKKQACSYRSVGEGRLKGVASAGVGHTMPLMTVIISFPGVNKKRNQTKPLNLK